MTVEKSVINFTLDYEKRVAVERVIDILKDLYVENLFDYSPFDNYDPDDVIDCLGELLNYSGINVS